MNTTPCWSRREYHVRSILWIATACGGGRYEATTGSLPRTGALVRSTWFTAEVLRRDIGRSRCAWGRSGLRLGLTIIRCVDITSTEAVGREEVASSPRLEIENSIKRQIRKERVNLRGIWEAEASGVAHLRRDTLNAISFVQMTIRG